MGSITAIALLSNVVFSSLPEWDREQGLESPPTLPLRLQRAPDGFGFGIYSGSPVGLAGLALSYKRKLFLTQMVFGGDVSIDNYRLSLDHLYQFYGHHPAVGGDSITIGEMSGSGPRFPVSAGIGVYGQLNQVTPSVFNNDRLQNNFGFRFPLNMVVHSKQVAIDASVDLAPTLQILPSISIGFQAGVGMRFYFFSKEAGTSGQ